jgi:hypothetical protein
MSAEHIGSLCVAAYLAANHSGLPEATPAILMTVGRFSARELPSGRFSRSFIGLVPIRRAGLVS